MPQDESLRPTLAEVAEDILLVRIQLVVLVPGTLRTTETDTLLTLARQGLLRPLRDELPLDLRRYPESECEDLALDVVPQTEIVLYRPQFRLRTHRDIEDLHDLKEGAAKARDFGTDNHVTGLQAAQQLAELALPVGLRPADGLRHPAVDNEVILCSKLLDFENLVLDGGFR